MSIGSATGTVSINVVATYSAEQARQHALDVLDACDEADRLLQLADPDRFIRECQALLQSALDNDPTLTDGNTIVRGSN